MKLAPGVLGERWCVCCCECKREAVLPCVTKHGARRFLDNGDWAEGPNGWLCPNCRHAAPKACCP